MYPSAAFLGPKVALLDERSGSDGDIFPAMFKAAKIGPLIGKRSWGGVVGISDHGQLIDGGTVNVPESATASAKGEWIIEGYGVDPDIEVENDPASLDRREGPAARARDLGSDDHAQDESGDPAEAAGG